MTSDPQRIVSAQVILAPASGARITPDTAITSQNIERFRPSADATSLLQTELTRAGFEVGPLVANSFSITAPAQTFEEVFKTTLGEEARGNVAVRAGAASNAQELPLNALPKAWTKHLIAITFTPPPDFGPTGY